MVAAKKREWRLKDLEAQYGNPLSAKGQAELKVIQQDWLARSRGTLSVHASL